MPTASATALLAEYEDLLDAEDAAVLEANSRDCVERVRRINQTAERLCDTLRAHPAIERIEYPKYRTPENYRAHRRPGGGYGGLFSLLLRNAETNAPGFSTPSPSPKGRTWARTSRFAARIRFSPTSTNSNSSSGAASPATC